MGLAVAAPAVRPAYAETLTFATHVVINEVASAPNGRPTAQYVEIYNASKQNQILRTADGITVNRRIGDAAEVTATGGMYRFPKNTYLSPRQAFVIAKCGTPFRNAFGYSPDFEFAAGCNDITVPNMERDSSWGIGSFDLASSGDTVVLIDTNGADISSFAYGNATLGSGTAAPLPPPGKALGRITDGFEATIAGSDERWDRSFDSRDPTPGAGHIVSAFGRLDETRVRVGFSEALVAGTVPVPKAMTTANFTLEGVFALEFAESKPLVLPDGTEPSTLVRPDTVIFNLLAGLTIAQVDASQSTIGLRNVVNGSNRVASGDTVRVRQAAVGADDITDLFLPGNGDAAAHLLLYLDLSSWVGDGDRLEAITLQLTPVAGSPSGAQLAPFSTSSAESGLGLYRDDGNGVFDESLDYPMPLLAPDNWEFNVPITLATELGDIADVLSTDVLNPPRFFAVARMPGISNGDAFTATLIATVIEMQDGARAALRPVSLFAATRDLVTQVITGDTAAPVIQPQSVSPQVAKDGDPVTIRFAVSEPSGADPAVQIDTHGAQKDPSSTTTSFVYRFTVDQEAGDEEGEHPIVIGVEDRAGYTASDNSLTVTFDYTPPEFSIPVEVLPAAVPAGGTVTITFEAGETLGGAPVVTLAGRPATLIGQLANAYTYSYTVDSDVDPEGSQLVLATIRDKPGNEITGQTAVWVDYSPPRFTADPVIDPPYAADGANLKITFDVNEPLAADPIVTLGNREAMLVSRNGMSYEYAFVVDKQRDPEGVFAATATVEDLLGNRGSATGGQVAFDFTAPQLSVLLDRRGASSQETVVPVQYSLLDAIGIDDEVTRLTFTRVRGAPDLRAHYLMKSGGITSDLGVNTVALDGALLGLVEGAFYTLTLDAADWVGNSSSTQAEGLLLYRGGKTVFEVSVGAKGSADGSPEKPYGTITAAVKAANAAAGGYVVVHPGVYEQRNGETFPINVSNDVSLIGYGADLCMIYGEAATTVLDLGPAQGSRLTGTNVSGLSVRCESTVAGAGAGIAIFAAESDVWVRNVIVDGCQTGIRLDYSAARLENNTIVNSSGHGIYLWFPLSADAGEYAVVRSNIVAFSRGAGLYWWIPGGKDNGPSAATDVTYNDLYANAKLAAGHALGEENLLIDPRFANADVSDWRLAADSPVVGAGPAGEPLGAFGGSGSVAVPLVPLSPVPLAHAPWLAAALAVVVSIASRKRRKR
ncbi:MAG: DUF1565 domain-containing protein [Candidatus Schekmanbacteria bacterium]|nr:DUF1565 domain-containing protein [Candidatus Schekmanbacteria bacterium]